MNEVTRILSSVDQGDANAAEQLLPLVYEELRRLAVQRMAQEAPGQTLQPTGLVHEAYLRLVATEQAQAWNSRGHFFVAAEDAEAARIVDLHFFAGLSIDEVADALGMSRATVYRQWAYARAWLRCQLGGEGNAPAW
jgi:DNA-directed RNA polymerase specialized sigma24 family protein